MFSCLRKHPMTKIAPSVKCPPEVTDIDIKNTKPTDRPLFVKRKDEIALLYIDRHGAHPFLHGTESSCTSCYHGSEILRVYVRIAL